MSWVDKIKGAVKARLEQTFNFDVEIGYRIVYEKIMAQDVKTSEASREMSRVLSQANKRIKRIDNAKNVYSPAREALGQEKFSLRGKDWEAQKAEYQKAVNFLNSKTSTLGDARKFTEEVAKKLNVSGDSDEAMKYIPDIIKTYGIETVEDAQLLDYEMISQYFIDYRNEKRERDISDLIEDDAKRKDAMNNALLNLNNGVLLGDETSMEVPTGIEITHIKVK